MTTDALLSMISSVLSSNTAGLFPTPSFNHLIIAKLDWENYLVWKAWFLPYLRSQQLLGFVDGSIAAPTKMITQIIEGVSTLVPNPDYIVWFQKDQIVLSALLSSLAIDVLPQVMQLDTSLAVWVALECMYSSYSRARIMQVWRQTGACKERKLLN